ncbi:hypothetical protein MA16_Dca029198 [Dendrobium catenatum]|uniref:Uncharacterized protein n=1 Tax=Dendrobium catenatum TaxID=906689 RepID=A0A2I0VGR3_9ASPA|nr:hypothetical protein MA16_Dca029198 [Dendrobium catenatum]
MSVLISAASRRLRPAKGGREGTCPFKSIQPNRIQRLRALGELIESSICLRVPVCDSEFPRNLAAFQHRLVQGEVGKDTCPFGFT